VRELLLPPRRGYSHRRQTHRGGDQGKSDSAPSFVSCTSAISNVHRQNDLGIAHDDFEAMTANLAAQGITDVKSINKFSGVDSTEDAKTGGKKPSGQAAGTKPRATHHDTGGSKKRVDGGKSSVNFSDTAEAGPVANGSKKRVEGGKSSVDLSDTAAAAPAANSLRKKAQSSGSTSSVNLRQDVVEAVSTTTSKKRSATGGGSTVMISHEGAAAQAPAPSAKKRVEGSGKSTFGNEASEEPDVPANPSKKRNPGAGSSSLVLG
jgi:hypothetical protein